MRLALLTSALLAALLLAACVQEEPAVTQDIVSAIPWSDQEQAEYVILNRDDREEQGHGVLSVMRRDDQFELSLRFESEAGTDEAVVLVDAMTLKPDSVRRERRLDETTIVEGKYDPAEGIVEITIVEDGHERLVPMRLKEHYYDNESSLFLWRTIPFVEGYQASYRSVLTNQRTQPVVTLKVAGREEVTVPAGTFQAWRVQIEFADVRQVAWYADTPEHLLVQYDNSIQLFQLTAR